MGAWSRWERITSRAGELSDQVKPDSAGEAQGKVQGGVPRAGSSQGKAGPGARAENEVTEKSTQTCWASSQAQTPVPNVHNRVPVPAGPHSILTPALQRDDASPLSVKAKGSTCSRAPSKGRLLIQPGVKAAPAVKPYAAVSVSSTT